MPQKLFVRAAMLLSACILTVRAEESALVQTTVPVSAVTADTAAALKTLPLLPGTMGPMESYLWDEHGFMRHHFDFPLTEEGREKEIKLRRTLLTWHEVAGSATLLAMIATCIVGQMAYNNSNHINSDLGDLKSSLGWATELMYFSTASLALFTPPPLVRHDKWNSISTHKLLATIHFTGMILTPILASQIGNEDGGRISRKVETAHMISGYATTATFAAAMMVIVF